MNLKNPIQTKYAIIAILTGLLVALIFLFLRNTPTPGTARDDHDDTTSYRIPTTVNIENGKLLANRYCSSCHMFPDPSLLSQVKWQALLPQMGLRLGIRRFQGEDYTLAVKAPDLVVPRKQILSNEQWQDVLDYYMNSSPRRLPPQDREMPIKKEMPYFSMIKPGINFFGGKVLGCMVRIDSSSSPARVYVADGRNNKLYLLTSKLRIIDSISTTGPVVDILFHNRKTFICTIGKELGANSARLGSVTELELHKNGRLRLNPKPLFSDLARPVKILAADLNGDSLTDYMICEFGNINGELAWMRNNGNGNYSKQVIRPVAGAISACLDYSANIKAPDIWVLFAQGEEGIYHFINDGKGGFEQKRVLRFPPIFGSSSFQMIDLNKDGFKDIVYTCGDNGDATFVKKPYHGLYLFMNDTHGNFEKKFFYPINGCYKAIAGDFDGDGNVDVATVSLFTDAHQPEEGFIFFKNTGGLHFTPFAFPKGTRFERAITMDAGDLDEDGRPDIVIGNAFFDIGPFKGNKSEPLFLILKNKASERKHSTGR